MATTMTEKHKATNRLSKGMTRPLSKSSSRFSSSPKSSEGSLNRTSQSRDMAGAGVNSAAWPLPEHAISEPQSQDSSSNPSTIRHLHASSEAPSQQQINTPQAIRQRAVSASQAQSYHQPLDLRMSGQSTLSSNSSKSVTDFQRLNPAQQTLNYRKSHGNLQSPPAVSHLQKSPPPTVPNSKVNPSLNYMNPANAKDPLVKKKKGGLFGGRSSKNTDNNIGPSAWVVGEASKVPYDVALLAAGAKVPELWQETGNALVYLFPPSSGRGPSFRLSSEVFSSSPGLTALVHGDVYSNRAASQMSQHSRPGAMFDPRTQQVHINTPGGMSVGASPNTSHTDGSEDSKEARGLVDVDGSQLLHIRLPIAFVDESGQNISQADVRKLVSVRNLFAFLIGQSLVATLEHPTVYDVFNQISKHLLEFQFSNMDGSTFGETPDSSFTCYVQELGLLDMRNNCEKTVDGLLLGERMRSALLWNEAFVHGVGLYDDLQRVCPVKFTKLSSVAIQRLERAHMDLEKRQRRINERLSDFDFPSIFSGIMNSRTAYERETASFEQWKSSFQATRRFFLQHLKGKHGSWPPKKTKKATIQVPNLNRRVLKGLANDLAVLYDLMVDRRHPSSRLVIFGRQFPAHPDDRIEALRKVLQEYDISGSPVYPTMPFDAPLLPRLSRSDINDSEAGSKKKIGKNDLISILSNSYNKDTRDARNGFAQLWIAFEAKTTSGMTIDKIANFRLGAWLFMYSVLQSLPMLTVDAPCVKFTEGAEYFLCQPPRGRLHWSTESTQKDWFRDPVTGVITQMSKDSIELSDDAIYRLSHCWKVGEIWEQELTVLPGAKRQKNQPSPPQGTPQLGPLAGVPPLADSPLLQGYSAQSSPMIPQSHQFPAQHHPSYPSPHQGSMYDLPLHGSNPHLVASPPLLPALGDPAYQQSPHLQAQSYPSPALGAVWEQPLAPGTPPHQQQQQRYSPPHLAPSSSDQLLPPPPMIPGIGLDDAYSNGGNSGSHSRTSSPYGGMGRRGNRESILMMGLERLPVPAPAPMSREERNAKTASMTFEDILPGQEAAQQQQKQRGRVPSRTGWI